jgi:hypothetical protein
MGVHTTLLKRFAQKGRPRCVGSVQRGGSTCNDSHAGPISHGP